MVRLQGPSARSAEEAVVQPETKYARLGGDRIAYQVLGEGPPDLVMTSPAGLPKTLNHPKKVKTPHPI